VPSRLSRGAQDVTALLTGQSGRHSQEHIGEHMDTTTLLIIILVIVLLGGGGWYGRGRWY
jgi:hypothetical protein